MTAQPPVIAIKVRLIAAGNSDVNPVAIIASLRLHRRIQVVVIVSDFRREVGRELIAEIQACQEEVGRLVIDRPAVVG